MRDESFLASLDTTRAPGLRLRQRLWKILATVRGMTCICETGAEEIGEMIQEASAEGAKHHT